MMWVSLKGVSFGHEIRPLQVTYPDTDCGAILSGSHGRAGVAGRSGMSYRAEGGYVGLAHCSTAPEFELTIFSRIE
ncbi:hypothetical protein E2C01_057529 [Portunus trituberculatus]|uniref:Uncharacterized protein n=1 Tax=Portunus trituberculatus TaxID=210409 RepID=A0A5B7GT47_PORTR|nr:hypothetical protein [Portunus trituberculatus]